MLAGQITDDTLMTLVMAEALSRPVETPDAQYFGRVFADWAREHTIWRTSPMFGPTTKGRFSRLVAGEDPVVVGTSGNTMTDGATNGAAMRSTPAGLIHPGAPRAAVEVAVQASLPTHGTQAGIAAAAAVAAGISEALRKDADVESVAAAAVEGAREGEGLAADKARIVPAPELWVRIEMGIDAVLTAGDLFESCRSITNAVGNGMAAYETVPAAVALFVAARGDPLHAVIGGANIGGDTDTIASIAGALSGALRGIEQVPQKLYLEVERVNGLGLEKVAERLLSRIFAQ
jgi:ADP-ribosylglycohydrolase